MDHFIHNLYLNIAAEIYHGDGLIAQIAQEAVEPLLQSLMALIPDNPDALEVITSMATELALPVANQIQAFVTSTVLEQLQDAAELTGIPQVLDWAFSSIENASRVLSSWVRKDNETVHQQETQAPEAQTPETQAPEAQAPETQEAPETQVPEPETNPDSSYSSTPFHRLSPEIFRNDVEMGKSSYIDPHSTHKRAGLDIIGEPGGTIQLRSPEEMLEEKVSLWVEPPMETIVLDELCDDGLAASCAGSLPTPGLILLLALGLFLGAWICLRLLRRSELARREKKIDSAASKPSSTPPNTTGDEVAGSHKRTRTISASAPSFISQYYSRSGIKAAASGFCKPEMEIDSEPLLISPVDSRRQERTHSPSRTALSSKAYLTSGST